MSSKVPEWWLLEEKKEYHPWLEWLEKEPRNVYGDKCLEDNIASEVVCYADIGAHTFFKTFNMEWVYKFLSGSVDKVGYGVLNEWQNILELIQ